MRRVKIETASKLPQITKIESTSGRKKKSSDEQPLPLSVKKLDSTLSKKSAEFKKLKSFNADEFRDEDLTTAKQPSSPIRRKIKTVPQE